MKPGHTYAVSGLKASGPMPGFVHCTDDLMPRDQWQPGKGKVAFDRVQVRMADAAGMNFDAYLSGSRFRFGALLKLKRIIRNRPWSVQDHGFHITVPA
jgi:hypothetical protein